MQKSKEKKLKKLKRISVVPHIIMLLIFVIVVAITASAFLEVFLFYVIGDRLDDTSLMAKKFGSYIESQMIGDNISVSTNSNEWADVDYAIYDTESDSFVVMPESDISLEQYVHFGFGDQRAYFDSINGTAITDISDDFEADFKDLLIGSISSIDFDSLVSNADDEINREIINIHAWVEQPIKQGRYNLYYSSDLILKTKDLLYILIVMVIMGLVVAIPMILYIITLVMSITGQHKTSKLLYYDPITGGKNWIYFENHGAGFLKKTKNGKARYAMVSFRMDRYQSFRACYGAASGENAIERINVVLKNHLNKRKELFARYSEAEFALLLTMDSQEGINKKIEELKTAAINILAPHKVDFSVGICEARYGEKIDAIYGNASLARKNIQPNNAEKIAWFDEKLREEQLWERYVEENMERALKDGELHVYLQPKYNAESEKLGGAEALIRWISKEKGFIGPGKFIPIFEKNGFITHIDDFMISSVAKLQAQWVKEGRNVVPISVNVSRAHFTQVDLAEHICKLVDDAGAPKELIELELTESAFFEDKDVLINTVDKLKNMGFKVSMDDFGAGYSSLNSLKDLKLDVLKIDADFFRGREENEQRGSLIVSETIQLAKSLGMTTVAEGIESADQVEFLAKSGCDLIQGYYFAKPMPVDEYVERMEKG